MKKQSQFQRKGFSTITAYLVVEKIKALIDFIQIVFNGKLKHQLTRKDGSVMHVEMQIGDAILMMGEANHDFPANNCMLYIYVENCDAIFEKALQNGATSIMPTTTMHHAGQRYGIVSFAGNSWCIATQLEDLTEEEQQARIQSMQ